LTKAHRKIIQVHRLFQPGEEMPMPLQTSDAGHGDAKYWHDGQSEIDGTDVQFIEGDSHHDID
jgi:hypothetical protein